VCNNLSLHCWNIEGGAFVVIIYPLAAGILGYDCIENLFPSLLAYWGWRWVGGGLLGMENLLPILYLPTAGILGI
jgi:hypothetical protein